MASILGHVGQSTLENRWGWQVEPLWLVVSEELKPTSLCYSDIGRNSGSASGGSGHRSRAERSGGTGGQEGG